jgi:esterase/lipase superfamily enzyme
MMHAIAIVNIMWCARRIVDQKEVVYGWIVGFVVFNTIFNNNSIVSWFYEWDQITHRAPTQTWRKCDN